MTPSLRRSAWSASLVAVAIPAATHAQELPPPPPTGSQAPLQPPSPFPSSNPTAARPAPGADPAGLAGSLADRLQDLAEDVASDLPADLDSQSIGRDAAELAQASRDFRAGIENRPDAFALRRQFSPIDNGWNALAGRIARLPNVPPSLVRASKRIEQVENTLRDAVGLNSGSGAYYGAVAPPSSPADLNRLAASMADRAAGLAAAVRQDAPTLPGGLVLAGDADALARESDFFHDSIGVDSRPDVAARAYAPVRAASARIETSAANLSGPSMSAWSSFVAARGLVEAGLAQSQAPIPAPAGPRPGLVPTPARVVDPAYAPAAATTTVVTPPAAPPGGFQINAPGMNIRVGGGGVRLGAPGVVVGDPVVVGGGGLAAAPGVLSQADLLVQQINDFLVVWSPTAGVVPLGGLMLSDARQLQAAAINFRQDAASGLDSGRLAYEFRDVDLIWQRLARRVNRVAQGRIGPNIAQVYKMGDTVSGIHQTLGLPGYPPVLQTYP